MRARLFCTLVIFVAVATMTFTQSGSVILLDDFEDATIRVAFPAGTVDADKFLWSHYSAFGEVGTAGLDTSQKYRGSKSYKVVITPSGGRGDVYEQFRPLVNNGSGIGNVRNFVQPTSAWTNNKFNRMRIWVKAPSAYPAPFSGFDGGNMTINVGTYVRNSSNDGSSNQEDGGGHFYHFYWIPFTNQWHQIVVDYHPTATRNGTSLPGGGVSDGNTDLWPTGSTWTQYPSFESGYNYFDAMTRFYIAGDTGCGCRFSAGQYPLTFYIDAIELYQDPSAANVRQVYALNGVYRASDNYLYVGWNRHKADDTVKFDVRYAFSDIFQLGWSAATPAPGGSGLNPPGSGGYNLMRYESTGISMGSNSTIYVAIKPQNSSSFSQIAVPLTQGSGPPPPPSAGAPAPPANLRITS